MILSKAFQFLTEAKSLKILNIFTYESSKLIRYNFFQNRPTRNCNGFSDCILEDGWKWIGGGPMPSQDIEPSHQAAVDLLEIRKPTNCVTFMARTVMINGELSIA